MSQDAPQQPKLPPYMTKLHVPGQRDAGKPTIVLPFPLLSDAELAQPYRPAGGSTAAATQKLTKG